MEDGTRQLEAFRGKSKRLKTSIMAMFATDGFCRRLTQAKTPETSRRQPRLEGATGPESRSPVFPRLHSHRACRRGRRVSGDPSYLMLSHRGPAYTMP